MARSGQAGATTSVRIAAPIEPELVYINLLTADERRDALVAAGRAKQRGLDVKLRQAVCRTQAELRAPTGLNRLASK